MQLDISIMMLTLLFHIMISITTYAEHDMSIALIVVLARCSLPFYFSVGVKNMPDEELYLGGKRQVASCERMMP